MKINPLSKNGVPAASARHNDEQTQRCPLAKDIMTAHDAVMPKMGAPPPDSGVQPRKKQCADKQ